MRENTKLNFNTISKICNIIKSATNLNVLMINKNGFSLLQLIAYNLPIESQKKDNSHICTVLNNNPSNSYYHSIDSYRLEYIYTGIWSQDIFYGVIVIGPFISSIPNTEFVHEVINQNNLSIGERKLLDEFYKTLPLIDINKANDIATLNVNLCSNPFVYSNLIISDIIHPLINNEKYKVSNMETKSIIELRYKCEKEISNAVLKGNNEEVHRILKEAKHLMDFPYRTSDNPLRVEKDVLITFNTILRIAAERGGVHPVYIHNLSEKFIIMLENTQNQITLKKLREIMINSYCDAVKTFSTSGYSPIIKKAVDYIDLNFTDRLTLTSIANEIGVSPSHLSRKFKNDTNMTVTEYINRKRVEEVKFYLDMGKFSFTEIALMVGFNDLNYFDRVFKKITSLTPSQYINRNLSDS